MIEIRRITTGDVSYYAYIEQLLIFSFPMEEYRDLYLWRECTDRQSNFHNNVILDDENLVGFISYWNFGHFYYIEHFAIDPSHRNGGYGQKSLAYLAGYLKKPLVLEVELPNDEMAQRRINFYKRQGFILWEKEYFQPPYRRGQSKLPMRLMAHGNLDCKQDFESIKQRIHHNVYPDFGKTD